MNSAQFFRQAIAKRLAQKTTCTESFCFQLLGMPKVARHGQFTIPLPKLVAQDATIQDIANKFEMDEWIAKAGTQGPFLQFNVQLDSYIQHTLNDVYEQKDNYGKRPPNNSTVLIDYSSPNIAKPFHAGHLRSTILGNFIKRSHEALGYRTIGINYLGDWGKQYGLLAVGYNIYGNETALTKDPIHHLYDVYVAINKDASSNPDIDTAANAYFKRMEQQDPPTLALWQRFRTLSIDFYRQIYRRLNITFDQYSGESQTQPYIGRVYDLLEKHGLLVTEGGECVVDLEPYKLGKPVVRRTDGTSLYLTRDLATLLMRTEQYGFDKAVYVVGSEQSLYMQQLFKVWELMTTGATSLHHANFGRIHGMSTRQGTVVFLQDILDTAQEKMCENIRSGSPEKYAELQQHGIMDGTTRLQDDAAIAYVSDQLGISAVIVQDMVAKRIKNYTFAWDRMTAAKGYTGVYLQFAYARLCGIERKAQVELPSPSRLDPALLVASDAAVDLALTISQYPDIVYQAAVAMEPSTLVQYLFRLAHSVSQATGALRVKGVDEPRQAEARMLLFWAAKTTLGNGMNLLGMTPLERI